MSVASPRPCSTADLPGDFPAACALLEEAVAAQPANRAASLAFACLRCDPARALLIVVPAGQAREFGRPSLHGLGWSGEVLMAMPRGEADALWVMEQGLKSAALGGVIGIVEGATLTQTRRLDFAARGGATPAILLRARGDGLSAAWRRWRIAACPSAANPDDPLAPGAARLHATLVRQRGGPPGDWLLDLDAAGGVAVATRLAADGASPDTGPDLRATA